MHRIARRMLVITFGLCPLQPAWPADEIIQFRKGDITGTVRGQVSQSIKTYQFRARKDQTVIVSLAPEGGDKGMLTFTLYAYCGETYGQPLVSDTLRWQGTLPCSDRYSIDVSPGSEAMRAAREQRYTLTLTIP